MTADYNGWTDAPEAEREALDQFAHQEFEREAVAGLEARPLSQLRLRNAGRTTDFPALRPAA